MTVRQEEYRKAIDHFAETLSAGHRFPPSRLNYTDRRNLRRLRRQAIRSPLSMYLILFPLGIGSAYLVQLLSGRMVLDSPAFYLGVPAILLGAYQAWLTSIIKQADQMQQYMSRLFSDDLFRTWYQLFYNYPNSVFDEVDALEGEERVKKLKELNFNREAGTRRWHPEPPHMWGTEEEGMIDALLSQLSILGDYYERGMLSLTEIGGVAEHYLLGVLNCHAFQAYIYFLRKGFRGETDQLTKAKDEGDDRPETPNRKKFGAPPYLHLCVLLRDLDELRKADENHIYGLLDQAVKGK